MDIPLPDDEKPRFVCHVCDHVTLPARADWDICPVCFWEDDGSDTLDGASARNEELTLRQARDNFRILGACSESAVSKVIPPEDRARFEHRPR